MHLYVVLAVVILNSALCYEADVNNRYCPDKKPQEHVAIQQLMGMWYGVEVISHKLAQDYGDQFTCPIIHISEDLSPYDRDLYYRRYGSSYRTPYQPPTTRQSPYEQDSFTTGPVYGQANRDRHRNRDYDYDNDNHRQQFGHDYPRRPGEIFKRLRLLWTENGNDVEYSLRYNVSRAGFWISSGPRNGSSLIDPYKQFAGTMQVIKAVGDHLVLLICHQLPDQQLYTVVLSRVPQLPRHDINDAHELLQKRTLEIHNIRKVCGNGVSDTLINFSLFLLLSIVPSYLNFSNHFII